MVKRSIEAMVAEEHAKKHHVLADQLSKSLQQNNVTDLRTVSSGDAARSLFYELTPRRTLDSLILKPEIVNSIRELVEEHTRIELLRAYNLEPRHRILLSGPPGNGKTSLAEAIAESLMLPMLIPNYDAIVGSYLGETAQRLRKLFDSVATQRAVLFFDEFDTIGKERADIHETGEIKRVVSSLLLQVDALPTHVIIICATNHPELLDRAVWRRFQLRLALSPPSKSEIVRWLEYFQEQHRLSLGMSLTDLSSKLGGLSYSEIEDFSLDVARRAALSGGARDIRQIVLNTLRSWRPRLMRR